MYKKYQILRNISMNYVTGITSTVIGIFIFPFIAGKIGASAFGAWLVLTAVTGFFTMTDFGISTSIIKYIAEAKTKKDYTFASKIASTGLYTYTILGVLVGALYLIICFSVWHSFHIPAGISTGCKAVVWITGITVLVLGIPLRSFVSVVAGEQRYDLSQLFLLLGLLLGTAYKIFTLFVWPSVVNVALGDMIISLLPGILSVVYVLRNMRYVNIRLDNVDFNLLKSIAPFSLQVAFMGALSFIILETDNIVISIVLTSGAVTIYNAGYRIYSTVRNLCNYISIPLLPKSTEMKFTDSDERMRSHLIFFSSVVVAVSWIVGVPVIYFSKQLIDIWVGNSYSGAVLIVKILMSSFLLNSIHLVANTYLAGIGKPGRFSFLHSLWVGVNLILSIFLSLRIGIVGVAIGTALPICFLEPFYIRVICREFSIKPSVFLSRVVGVNIICGLVGGGALFAVQDLMERTSVIVHVLVSSVCYGLLFCLTYLLFGVFSNQKMLLTKLRTKLGSRFG